MNHHATHLARRLIVLAAVTLLLIVWLVGSATGDTVTLKPQADLPATTAGIALADVAELDGPYAQSLAGLVLFTSEKQAKIPANLRISRLRDALSAAGVNWAKVSLKGHAVCTLNVETSSPPDVSTQTPIADPTTNKNQTPTLPADGTVAPLLQNPIDTDTPATVRGLIERVLLEGLAHPKSEITITFEPRHAKVLDASTLGAAFEVAPVGQVRLGRMNLRVRRVAGYGDDAEHLIPVRTQWRTRIVVATAPIQRHERLTQHNLALQEVVLDRPYRSHLFDLDAVRGAVCGTALRSGQPVLAEHLGLPVLVKRGERITLQMNRQGFRVDAVGFAETDAALGESVLVRLDARRRRGLPTVTGTVTGLARVTVAAPSTEPSPRPLLASGD